MCVFLIPRTDNYSWLRENAQTESIVSRIPVPDGYIRIKTVAGGFENWLRHLPLKRGTATVYLYDGKKKANQDAHFAVVDIDVGGRNLQQCADAIIRLRAEYLYSVKKQNVIQFKFTSGHNAKYKKWVAGYRPVISGNRVRWVKRAPGDSSYSGFRKYLDSVFIYAGSYSLDKELHRANDVGDIKIGDVFIEGGFPGHAVIVLDLAVHKRSGKKIFLLAQSYMPAQDIHILKNLNNPEISPWYELKPGESLDTPEWVFASGTLKRF